METLISIIVPVYNVEAYVEKCVRSIMAQTYQNLEIILVDDGSTDNSGNICDALAAEDSRITVYHTENSGVSDARNLGVANSHGEYIGFVDSDDYVSDEYVSYLFELLTAHGADVSCCQYQTIYDHSQTLGVSEGTVRVLSGHEATALLMTYDIVWAKLCKADLVRRFPFPSGRKHEDTVTICKYFYYSNKVVDSTKVLYAYFINPDGIMQTLKKVKDTDRIWACSERAKWFEGLNEKKLAAVAWHTAFGTFIRDSRENGISCSDEIRHFMKGRWFSGYVPLKTRLYCAIYLISPKLCAKCKDIYSRLRRT